MGQIGYQGENALSLSQLQAAIPSQAFPHGTPMDLETQQLSVEWVAIERLFCSPANPRHNDDGVPHVTSSIRRFGWQQPIVVRPSGEVIAGNTRLKAAQELGLEEVPVAWFDGSDTDATAYQ